MKNAQYDEMVDPAILNIEILLTAYLEGDGRFIFFRDVATQKIVCGTFYDCDDLKTLNRYSDDLEALRNEAVTVDCRHYLDLDPGWDGNMLEGDCFGFRFQGVDDEKEAQKLCETVNSSEFEKCCKVRKGNSMDFIDLYDH